jgi:hypothetical protein
MSEPIERLKISRMLFCDAMGRTLFVFCNCDEIDVKEVAEYFVAEAALLTRISERKK